jgi:putative hydrolase of the HAD superfamily
MYKAIIFDLGGVLVHFDFRRAYQSMAEVCPYAAGAISERIAATGLVERFETGLVEPGDFFAQLSRTLELRLDYDGFCRIWNRIFTVPLLPESLLEGLASRYRLLLLSNTNAIHFAMIRQAYPMLRHFQEVVLSFEVRALKPGPEIFRVAIGRAGCRPEECFYTDDTAAHVDAARALGIDAVRFVDRDQLERELTARGIRWDCPGLLKGGRVR